MSNIARLGSSRTSTIELASTIRLGIDDQVRRRSHRTSMFDSAGEISGGARAVRNLHGEWILLGRANHLHAGRSLTRALAIAGGSPFNPMEALRYE